MRIIQYIVNIYITCIKQCGLVLMLHLVGVVIDHILQPYLRSHTFKEMARSFTSLFALAALCSCALGDYLLGVGRYDITGPAVQIEMVSLLFGLIYQLIIDTTYTIINRLMDDGLFSPLILLLQMGMANPKQIAHGIHFRQYSRAYIIADSKNPKNRVVFVSIDACMGTQIMKMKVRAFDNDLR